MKQGYVAEYETSEELVAAAEYLVRERYLAFETYTPYPVERLRAVMPNDTPRPKTPIIAAVSGFGGAALAYLLMYWINVYDYPYNIGGLAPHSAPAFIPITFETGILCAAIGTFFGMMIALRLPRLDGALFEVPGFERASIDRFFLAIPSADARFDSEGTLDDLRRTGALRVVSFGSFS